MSGDHLDVALYAGIVVRRDAVSWSVLHKLNVFRRLIAMGAPIRVTCFAQSIEDLGPELVCCPSVAKLLGRSAFWDADVHIYEEGMYYELFDSIHVVPEGRPILAIEHNSTPVELIDVPGMRLAVERSHAQRRNLLRADHVACVSEFNLEMARAAGVPEEKLSVLHLPAAIVPSGPVRRLVDHEGPLRLLYLGRFVRAKGILDMLELARRLLTDDDRFQITLAGDPRFSDPAIMDEIERTVAESRGRVEVAWAPDDAETARLYERCDALVVPSYHEGYCVPVVEAYGFERFVIAYDQGNIPNVVGGLGLTVACGDVGALEAAVREFARALCPERSNSLALPTGLGDLAFSDWVDRVARHLADYSAAAFERTFLGLLHELAASSPSGLGPVMGRAIEDRLREVAGFEKGSAALRLGPRG
jgi:glycosyltransferase involved in cell wall biosynthesis